MSKAKSKNRKTSRKRKSGGIQVAQTADVKVRANDVYEAEDSDAEEVKHSYKFDEVDNYQYQSPDEFEDEEIEEEEAFNEEDKLMYADFFGGASNGMSGATASGEDAGSDDDQRVALASDSSGEEEAYNTDDFSGEEEAPLPSSAVRGTQPSGSESSDPEREQPGEEGGLFSDVDEEAVMMEAEEEAQAAGDAEAAGPREGGDAPSGAHDAMLDAITGGDSGRRRGRGAVVNEVRPESEFNLGGEGAGVTVSDLLSGLGAAKHKLGGQRKVLEKLETKEAPMSAPLPRNIKARATRQAGYEQSSKEVSKWNTIVKANRQAPTISFQPAKQDVHAPVTTGALAAAWQPSNDMEQEIAGLLKAAGAADGKAVQEAEEALALKTLTVEEVQARRDKLAKARAAMFYHEIKSKHLKSIKSKEYRRKVKIADKRRALKGGDADGDDEEAVRDMREKDEFERAKERLTLKHKNTSRWARRALKRGLALQDDGTREAVEEQLRLGQELRNKVDRVHDSSESDDATDAGGGDSTSASEEDEGGAGALTAGRGVRAAALEVLRGGGDQDAPPTKGLFALPFMRRAAERQRAAAQQEAQDVLRDLDGPEGAAGAAPAAPASGRASFGGAASDAQGYVLPARDDEAGSSEDDLEEDAEAKLERLSGRGTGEVPPAETRGAGCQEVAAAPPAAPASGPTPAVLSTGVGRHTIDGVRGSTRRRGAVAPAARAQADCAASSTPATGPSGVARDPYYPAQERSAASPSTPSTEATPAAANRAKHPPAFIKSPTFTGVREGHVFKKGKKGLGYYRDAAAARSVPQKRAVSIAGKAAAAAATVLPGQQHPKTGKAGEGGGQSHSDAKGDGSPGDESDSDGQADFMRILSGGAKAQQELVNMAFAADDVQTEFQADKAEEAEKELPPIDEPVDLPGWGKWGSDKREPKWLTQQKAKAKQQKEDALLKRKDRTLTHVVISEKWDKTFQNKYGVASAPFPFTSKATYDASIRQPLGKDFNPTTNHRDMVRPAVLKKTGVVIEPAKFSDHAAKEAGAKGMTSTKRKFAPIQDIQGGNFKKGKSMKNYRKQ